MIVSINQPAYLPWLGYFDRIARSDLHIVLDNVQLERNTKTSFTNRNRVKTPQGTVWLTVPVKKATTPDEAIINRCQIDGEKWAMKHWKTLEQHYSRAPHFGEYREWFRDFFSASHPRLAPMLHESTEFLLTALGISTKLVYASDLNVPGTKAELVINLCKEVGATGYLSGPFGRDYLDAGTFEDQGVDLLFHDYSHPTYPQLHGEFIPYMSTVDLLFNCGLHAYSNLNCGNSQ